MDITARRYDDPSEFAVAAKAFLERQPVLHNLILTIVEGRRKRPEPGQYWLARRGDEMVGAALQSPLTFPATLVPMETEVAWAMADAIADAGVALPGVNGEAGTAASFAGRWTERTKAAAVPTMGLRLYELITLRSPGDVTGLLRKAAAADRERLVRWMKEFYAETKMPATDFESYVDAALSEARLWVWDCNAAVSMATVSEPMAGVVRVSLVYTPPEMRGRGYASACVHGISRAMVESGNRCALYTDLSNPVSNSIYRRVGYEAVMEGLSYTFEARHV